MNQKYCYVFCTVNQHPPGVREVPKEDKWYKKIASWLNGAVMYSNLSPYIQQPRVIRFNLDELLEAVNRRASEKDLTILDATYSILEHKYFGSDGYFCPYIFCIAIGEREHNLIWNYLQAQPSIARIIQECKGNAPRNYILIDSGLRERFQHFANLYWKKFPEDDRAFI